MFKLNISETSKIQNLFKNTECKILKSYMQGFSGECYVDNAFSPKTALVCQKIFHFIGGQLNPKLWDSLLDILPCESIIICDSPEWYTFMEKSNQIETTRLTRYKFYADKNKFDLKKIKMYADSLPKGYSFQMMDESNTSKSYISHVSEDLLGVFHKEEDFLKRGCGVLVLHDNIPVSGASSFSVYKEGIEIEVDTHPDYRKKGLGIAAAAKLMLHCFSQNIYPNWDAANLVSVRIAEKLGYLMKSPYTAMFVKKI